MKWKERLYPIDYAFVIGGPLICLAIVWIGIRSIMGSPARPNPVQMLRDNVIQIGATREVVLEKLGRPSRVQVDEDGSVSLVYTRTVLESSGSDSLDEAILDLTPSGRVEAIRFDRSSPPSPK